MTVARGERLTRGVRSNSTWIAEDTPCITYGLRGVVHCNVEVGFSLFRDARLLRCSGRL